MHDCVSSQLFETEVCVLVSDIQVHQERRQSGQHLLRLTALLFAFGWRSRLEATSQALGSATSQQASSAFGLPRLRITYPWSGNQHVRS